MRIAFISTMQGYAWGGSEELWYRTALYALESGHEVWVTVNARDEANAKLEHLETRGAMVFRRTTPNFEVEPHLKAKAEKRMKLPFWKRGLIKFKNACWGEPFPPSPKRPKYLYNQALLHLLAFHPDAVCISQGGAYETAFMPLADLLLDAAFPYLLVCHSYTDREVPSVPERQRVIKLFKAARKVCMIAKHQMSTVERQLAVKCSNMIQVENPVNLQKFIRMPMPSGACVKMAMVGSLTVNWKGQDVMFELLGQPEWLGREWELNLYGKGPDEEYLKQLAVFYGISERVHFHGHVPDITTIWRDNHLLLVPSRQDSGPMVLVEAMLCGRPVLAAAVGLAVEWIKEGFNGFIAPAATVPLLSQALERAWLEKEHWHTMGENAFGYAMARTSRNPERTFFTYLAG